MDAEDSERVRLRDRLRDKLSEAGKLGHPVHRDNIREHDEVRTAQRVGGICYGGMSGVVLAVGKANVVMHVDYKPAPDGPIRARASRAAGSLGLGRARRLILRDRRRTRSALRLPGVAWLSVKVRSGSSSASRRLKALSSTGSSLSVVTSRIGTSTAP